MDAEEPCSSSSALADMFMEKIIFYIISLRSSLTVRNRSDNSSKYSLENTRISKSKSRQVFFFGMSSKKTVQQCV